MTFSCSDSQTQSQRAGSPLPSLTVSPASGERRTRRQFPNGLTVVAESMPVDAVNLSLWVNVGSAAEVAPINGMAHFLEHMVFKGTNRLALGEFERRTEAFGAVTNAATSQDYTQFYLTCAPRDFKELAALQIDVVLNASLPDQEFDRERRVVLEEIRRSEDSPRRRIFRQISNAGFEGSPYSRPILGPPEVIEKMTPEEMRRFHRQHYRPENVTAVAVGNLPTEELISAVVDGFEQAWGEGKWSGDRPNESPSLDQGTDHLAPFAVEPTPTWEPFKTIERWDGEDKGLQQTRLALVWRVPGINAPGSDEPGINTLDQSYPLDVLATILSRGRTSRLVRELREEKGLVTYISASNLTYAHQGLFYVSAQLPAENVELVEAKVREHIAHLWKEPVTESELARVKTRVANSFIFGNETPSNRAGLYGYYETLAGDMHQGIHYPAAIRRLTLEDLQQSARQWLNPDAYGVVTIHPTA
ncbi:MAG: pitrilysin family protein [Cyanobacteria bacterium P01_C01_bin.89]